MEENIKNIINDPINTLKKLSNDEIVKILEHANTAFFNTHKTIFSDDIYDIVKDYLKKKNPTNKFFKKVGADIEINKETLPFYMGSLDKIKDNVDEIMKWKKKYKDSYVVSEKLDGISCLLYYDNGTTKLWTRGNGTEGQNITHILPYLNFDISKFKEKIAIRGELIISRANWEKISDLGANARNVVAGATHAKTINKDIIEKIDFVAYDVLYPRNKLSISFENLKKLDAGIKIVKYVSINENELTYEYLSDVLKDWRTTSLYEIDGIVVCCDKVYKIVNGKNSKNSFAFKSIHTHTQVEVIVEDVEWNVSKHRYIKPIVKFNEIVLGGVKIKQATGFNAAFIINNKIGPGSHIIVIRSGDVIPHILSVLTPSASGLPKLPTIPYIWASDTHVDIMLKNDEKNKEQDVKSYTHFMKALDIDGVKEGVITKMYDAGYDTLKKILHITYEELLSIEGFKDKISKKILEEFKKIHNTECLKLMSASNIFGHGYASFRVFRSAFRHVLHQ